VAVELDGVAAAVVDRLRAAGLVVSTGQAVRFAEAVVATSGSHVRDVARATLASSPEDVDLIDDALAPQRQAGVDSWTTPPTNLLVDDNRPAPSEPEAIDATRASATKASSSRLEVLRRQDIAALSDAERAELHGMMRRLSFEGAPKRTRRRGAPSRRGITDVRATTRAALRTDTELMRLHRRARRQRPRDVVLLIDVSGSMESYDRALLRLAHVGVAGRGRVEVFALGTRLTRLTRALSQRDPDAAFRAALDAARDWGGGTRLGETLAALFDDPAAAGAIRGSVVVIVSDGLDRGSPQQLGEQMERLARSASRLIWVNPLRARDGYEPLAAGMSAALPHVGAFVDGHSLEAIEDLAALVAQPARTSTRA
jgi:uncharacterized protein with von Willebrand factor type A (vWA) domain